MLVHKGHRIQLLPNNRQRNVFCRWSGAHRWAWNYGLERKKSKYEETGQAPSAYTLMKEIVKLKREPETAWLSDVAKSVPRMALLHLEEAYKNFFRRCKRGADKKGFPRFKSKRRSKMVFHLEPDTVRMKGKLVYIARLGWVRMSKPLRFDGKLVSSVAISRRAGKWYISFSIETEHVPAETQGGAVGIDLGVKTLATLSDGTRFENPKARKRYEKLLARAQRQLARKQVGSNRWQKAKLRVQRIQKRIADIRANATHKATSYIAQTYSLVAMENLNASGMIQNHCLAGAVADANFSEFRRQIEYKVAWEQGKVVVVERFFASSKLCSVCGCINDNLTLADREWTCVCGAIHDRDKNAAINLRNWVLDRRGLPVAGRGGQGAARPADETSMGQRKYKSSPYEAT